MRAAVPAFLAGWYVAHVPGFTFAVVLLTIAAWAVGAGLLVRWIHGWPKQGGYRKLPTKANRERYGR